MISNEGKTSESTILHFKEGIPGFENVNEYRLYHEDDINMIWSLQAADRDFPYFIVIDPFQIVADYCPVLSAADLEYFGNSELSDLCFLTVAVIKSPLADSVTNLKAPIVINVQTKQAKQIIMEDAEYPIRYKLFANKE